MSLLYVDQLKPGVVFSQKFRIYRPVQMRHFRPWVYFQGDLQDGQFECRVYQNGNLLKSSQIDFTEINAAKTETYAHGYIRFDFDSQALFVEEGEENTEYEIQLEMINHTLDNTNWLGVVREWDAKSATLYGDGLDQNNQAINDLIEPLGYQIYELRSH